MKILYHINSPETIYAARFIYEGYKNAFVDKGHKFDIYTANDNLSKKLETIDPDIFITSINEYNLKFLDLNLLQQYRKKGMVMFTQIMPWKKQNEQFGGGDLEHAIKSIQLIKDGLAGDIFFHWLEQNDPSMDGFTKNTGYPFHTILLAADTSKYYYEHDEKYKADISFVGSYLPDKRDFINERFKPLMKKYNFKVYGSDWTLSNRLLGYVQKGGQYFNIKPLKGIRKMQLPLDDEHIVYSSSTISLNIHEEHQRKFGSDFNERTFKIIASGGFEICDNVSILRKYFTPEELVIAKDKDDWFDKIDYYISNPDKRKPIIQAGIKKIRSCHTYQNRVDQIISIYNKYKS